MMKKYFKKPLFLITLFLFIILILGSVLTIFIIKNDLDHKYTQAALLYKSEKDKNLDLNKKLDDKTAEINKLTEEISKLKGVNIPQDKILYFYSDSCSFCIKQKPVVEELEKEGLVFQWMNVEENKNLFNDYQLEGTPAFIYKKLDNKLVGLQEKEAIRNFWEEIN